MQWIGTGLTLLAAGSHEAAKAFSFEVPSRQVLRPSFTRLLSTPQENMNENEEERNEDEKEDNTLFLESLRQAANSKLGAPIPSSEFVAKSTNQAENEFLRAMQEARQEFIDAKEQRGGDVDDAIQMVMGKMQRQEETLEKMEEEWSQEADEEDDGEDNSMSFQ